MDQNDKLRFPYDFMAYHFLDASGNLKAMEEDGSKTEKFLREGFNVDGSSIKGMAQVESSDLTVMPEPDTFQRIQVGPMDHNRFMCHLLMDNGQRHPCDPRNILHKQVSRAQAMGFEPYMFSEVEFFLVDADTGLPSDQGTYCSLPPEDKAYQFRQQLGKICKQCGMEVKRIHHECGPGQNEIELNLTPSMKNADDTVLSQWIMKLLAAESNQRVLFNPKPLDGEAGNGMHHHIMLRDLQTGQNVFQTAGVTDRQDLSDVAKFGIAGLIHYADEITAVFAASEESFERLRPGFEAPIFKAWGYSNRTCLVRVPQTGADLTRFEYRGGDLSGSVHLFGAVLLAAVLEGIRSKLELPPPSDFNVEELSEQELTERNLHRVPLTMAASLQVLKESEFLRDALGEPMVQLLIERNEQAIRSSNNGKQLVPSTAISAIQKVETTLTEAARLAKHMVFQH